VIGPGRPRGATLGDRHRATARGSTRRTAAPGDAGRGTGNVLQMEANAAAGQGVGAAGHGSHPARPLDGQSADRQPSAQGADGTSEPGGPGPDGPTTGTGLAPLPYDGVGSVAVGTVLWLIALIVMIPFASQLRSAGRLWWLATAACGVGLGLLGLVIVIRRRSRIRRSTTPRAD